MKRNCFRGPDTILTINFTLSSEKKQKRNGRRGKCGCLSLQFLTSLLHQLNEKYKPLYWTQMLSFSFAFTWIIFIVLFVVRDFFILLLLFWDFAVSPNAIHSFRKAL